MKTHLILRTSPKGQDFVGHCPYCGKAGLTFASMNEECPAPEPQQPQRIVDAVLGNLDGPAEQKETDPSP